MQKCFILEAVLSTGAVEGLRMSLEPLERSPMMIPPLSTLSTLSLTTFPPSPFPSISLISGHGTRLIPRPKFGIRINQSNIIEVIVALQNITTP